MFRKNYILRSSDFDRYDNIRPSSVLDIFQDVAGQHAESFNAGYSDLKKDNILWVILRTKFEVIKEPKFYSEVEVNTFPIKPGRADFDRDYIIQSYGETVIKGSSKWCLINSETRKIVFDKKLDLGDYEEKSIYENGLKKIPNFSSEDCEVYKGKASFSLLDHNGHVNNAKYADIITDAIGRELVGGIKVFEIDYIHELLPNSDYELYYKKESGEFIIKCVSGGVDIFRAKLTA